MLRFQSRALAIVACFTAITAVGHAQAAGRPLAVEDYYKIKTVGGAEFSNDARWVAFTVSTRVEETNGNTSEVWLVPADASSAARRVSPAGANASGASWLDDGRLRFSVGTKAYALNPATPAQVDSTNVPAGSASGGRGGRGAGGRGGRGGAGAGGGRGATEMSPDGKLSASVRDVAYTPKPKQQLTDFEKRHEDRFKGVEFDWLNFHRDGAPTFPIPDAKSPDVNPPQEVFLGDKQLTHLGLRPAGVQWLHDNSGVIFNADSTYRNELSYGKNDIWSASVDGRARRLTPNPDYGYAGARLSPDGQWILSTRQLTRDYVISKKLDHGGAEDLVIMPANGGAEKNLTADWDYLPTAAQWSPDSKYIYFQGGVGGSTHLFRVSPNGGPVEQITKGERDIIGLQFDKTFTKLLYSVGHFEVPSELYTANIDGSGEKQLTHVFDPFSAEVALSKTDRLLFKSLDGTQIEGWLLYPYGYRANGGPYPMIVASHGGPHAAVNYGFNFKNQYFAANGYFVLEVNFRSSTGYGEKFLWGTWGAWGTKDGQDVMAGIDYAISKYPIDTHHVGSIGHSYGGFMTNWLIGQYPDRFAAAASGAGIVNWTSDYGNADIPVTKEMEFYGSPWDPRARDIMIKQSPLTYANRVKAATLFINGEIDQRVPFSENEQLFVALKKNGVPAKMIRYDNQPHGIAGSWNNVHRMLNERRWFDQYLKSVKQ